MIDPFFNDDDSMGDAIEAFYTDGEGLVDAFSCTHEEKVRMAHRR